LDRDVDPREAILKYAEEAEKDPYWVAPAYKNTQPTLLLAPEVFEDDELDRVVEKEDRQRAKRSRDE
jgi:WD repeat-containing protein 70